MKTIFYVGRSYPHRDALLQLKARGYNLGIFHDKSLTLKNEDIFDHIVALDFSSEDNFRQSLDRTTNLPKIDGLLCSHENYIVFKAIAAEKLGLLSLSVESARACTDKYAMRSRFLDYNPEITPKFTFVESEQQLLAFAEQTGYPLILKPTNLVKSLLVTKCSNKDELLNAYRTTVTQIDGIYKKYGVTHRKPGLILEKFIEGRMCSVAAFVDQNGTPHFCDGIVDLVTAQNIGYDDNFLHARKLVNDFDPALKEKIFKVARDGIAALDMRTSPAHVEIIYNDNEVQLVEIGARTGGYRPFLYKQSYGIDMLEQEARNAVGEQPLMDGDFVNYSALYELFPRSKSTFVNLEGLKSKTHYSYLHEVAKAGDQVGCAKDGYKSLAIIGITDNDLKSFNDKSSAVENIRVITR